MKIKLFIIGALAGGMLLSSCGGDTEARQMELENFLSDIEDKAEEVAPEPEEEHYTTEEGGFSINFQGHTPTISSQDIDTEYGPVEINMYMYEKSATNVFMVSYNEIDLTEDLVDIKSIQEESVKSAFTQMGISDLKSKDFNEVSGYPGMRAKGDNGEIYVDYQVCTVGNKFFQIAVIKQYAETSKETVDAFFDSFKVLEEEK